MDELDQPADWRDGFVLARDIREVGAQSQLYRDANSGQLERLARGAYRAPPNALTDDERYLALIRARAIVSKSAPVFSHMSAARIWGLPIFERWPVVVEVEVGWSRNGRSIPGLRRHRSAEPVAPTWRGGLLLTSLARTVADVASTASPETAVMVIDSALHGLRGSTGQVVRFPLSRDLLAEELARRENPRGRRQLSWATTFGDGLAESPGESLSRLTMYRIGCPPPILQHSFSNAGRFVAKTDFWWPEHNLVGEFDGRGKYLRDEFLAGGSSGDAVVAEKVREDELRSLGPGMVRWLWEHAKSPRELRLKLTRAGLPCAK